MGTNSEKAVLFNIQRFSTEDGPGIRTSLFFKGCPLVCPWCHNPEGIEAGAVTVWQRALCMDCGDCEEACPEGAVVRGDGGVRVDREACAACGTCAEACPAGAMELVGRSYTADELLAEALKDRSFYDSSGGGITLTGGEPLSQYRFLAGFLPLLRNEGIRIALDTSGIASRAAFETVLPLVDMVLLDLKISDAAAHKDVVGAGLDRVLDAMDLIGASGLPVWVRTPVIPGATDSVENMRALAEEALRRLPRLEKYDLLAFSNMCGSKYEMLGLDFAYHGVPLMEAGAMDELADAVRGCGIDAVSWSGPVRSDRKQEDA